MATSPLNVQPSSHARSNSLPSRQHPITSQIDENLNRLRASQSASTSSSIGHQLNCLQDLYDSVDMLLQLPLAQQALAQEQQRKSVEQLLDGSLMLLDVCGTAKDALLQTKKCTQELQSVLRRRRGVEGLANEVREYLTSRKAVRKAICKVLKNLKHMENRLSSSSFSNDDETVVMISTLKQAEAVTIGVLKSLLSFITGPKAESKSSRWSLVSKFMHQKKVICEEEEQRANEIENADATLRSMIKSGNVKYVENVQNELQNSEMCIQDLDEGLESFFRRRDNGYRSFNHPNRLPHCSNSFPSRSHPLTSEVDEHLSRLASSESATKLSLLNHKLGRVQDLHDCIEKMLQLPFTQQMLSQEQQRECVDELLNGSLRLLDVCAMAKDALLQVKECTLELQSVLRRKRGATKGFANEDDINLVECLLTELQSWVRGDIA
ncbi:hypothetical protein V6N11_040698 [Hibiscus sabdariffa]|uniref:Uncharacterized protein n=1 Tax=Hibiscus sabdariffa TaxID=183260 RepID=A0ABR2RIA6_9ROSI